MRDDFLTKKSCDRCHGSLTDGRIMSMFNTDTICMTCKDKERKLSSYGAAVEADHNNIRRGNYNFKGIGLP